MFKFSDFVERIPLFYPKGYKNFNKLPDAYDPFQAPSDETEPSAWMMNISGDYNLHIILTLINAKAIVCSVDFKKW